MKRLRLRGRGAAAWLWTANPPLAAVALIMLAALAASAAALWLDPRTILGAPAWLKPAKFAASTAIYCVTLAWVFTFLPEWTRTRRLVGWTTAVVFVLEVAIIDVQAWRGTTSHFNVSTPLDAVLFSVMGAGIAVQTIAAAAVVVALWRQRFADNVIGWALRAGMTITIVGAASGGLMTRPTGAQLAEAHRTHRLVAAGAHTVGAPDGGPGLPGTGWSRDHGDLRVPHFVGLHAMQGLALVAAAVRRRARTANGAALMRVAGASYAALFVILLWQALRGEAVGEPTAATIAALGGWAVATAATAWAATRRGLASRGRAAAIFG